MKTSLDCLPCLLRQVLLTSRLTGAAESVQKKTIDAALALLADINHRLSPPENAVYLYRMISELTGCPDPYRRLKDLSTTRAMALRPMAETAIGAHPTPFLAALKFAAAGNIIDYGSHHDFDLDKTLSSCLDQTFAVDDSGQLRQDLARAKTVLYLADNCGELIFDGLLIQQLGKKTWLAVKEHPVINDATAEDALASGLHSHATIVTNGTDCPGTPLSQCTPEFLHLFHSADIVISKGQGNFETLSREAAFHPEQTTTPPIDIPAGTRQVYFLLTVKCPVVATHINHSQAGRAVVRQGETVLMKNWAS